MNKVLDIKRKPIFACIGTKQSFYDNTSNRIGDLLKLKGFEVVLNFNSINMNKKRKELYEIANKYDNPQIIAIDLSLIDKDVEYEYQNCGIKPGSGLGKKHDTIGEVSIKINLNKFEKIQSKLDIAIIISKKTGNKKIYKTEKKIVNELVTFYGAN